MAHLFIEFLSEEIPALMQKKARLDLKNLAATFLDQAGLHHGEMQVYSTPRRLVLSVCDVPTQQSDRVEVIKGPRVDGPRAAIEGFLKTNQITLEACASEETQKGTFYVLKKQIKGQKTEDVLPAIVRDIIARFSWPKSMVWGTSARSWVRPLQSGLCFLDDMPLQFDVSFGPEGSLSEKRVSFGTSTTGHRLLAPQRFFVTNYKDYQEKLAAHFVMLDQDARQALISQQMQAELQKIGESITLVDDPQLLEEVVGLVEWPVVLVGQIEPAFMHLPPELLMTTMRVHQRYFATKRASGELSPYFFMVSNQKAPDGGRMIVHGNQRVLRARLSDARFFYDLDLKTSLKDQAKKLGALTFYQKLGTVLDKSHRLGEIAFAIAERFGVDPKKAKQAASIAKADLVSEMVKEFPELQGIMGKYYARAEGMDVSVAEALEGHYRPRSAEDGLPEERLSRVVGLVDRLDTLLGFFAIGVKPSGSKDPFALRRACLGIIRLLEHNTDVSLESLFDVTYDQYVPLWLKENTAVTSKAETIDALNTFFAERLRVFYRDKGIRHDYVTAALQGGKADPLGVLKARLLALKDFLDGESDGQNLLTAYKRASNILRIEEKKEGHFFDGTVREDLLREDAEKELNEKLKNLRISVAPLLSRFDFEATMQQLATLRSFVDTYFDKVTVNADEAALRHNRLQTLACLRQTMETIVDFSVLE